MVTIAERINQWRTGEIRWTSQTNDKVLTRWFNKGFHIFQKYLLEYASWLSSTSVRFRDIVRGEDEYEFPLWLENVEDFYSIIQLRVAYKTDKYWNPLYRVCKPINFGDYNLNPLKNTTVDWKIKLQGWRQIWEPIVWNKVSMVSPRYIFVGKNKIKIFPTPMENVTRWLTLAYNFIERPLTEDQIFGNSPVTEADLNLPWYFLDAIDDYLSYQLYMKENPEIAEPYFQSFLTTLHDNIYWFNRDQRKIEEEMMNTYYFSHN